VTADRVLVVNADDFGRTPGVNRGIIEAHEHGIVTDATLMVRWPAAEDAGVYARQRPRLGIGLHLDLAEWEYVDGAWRPVYEVVDTDDEASVQAELDRQLGRFLRLVGRAPTHLDSHQHVHREDPVRSVLARAGHQLGVPVRDVTPGITYCGSFYGQDGRGWPVPEAITVDALVALIRDLPIGITELGCHPGDPVDLANVYRDERATELEALCHPRARRVIAEHGIRLVSFGELAGLARPLRPE
jgi:predicted glycoside hydrolase/deacetylase ChbG (UPF0249 family)